MNYALLSLIGPAVNENKRKYLVSTVKDYSIRKFVETDSFHFEVGKDFIYLGFSINTYNDISPAFKRRITLANGYYLGLKTQLSQKDLSHISYCRSYYIGQDLDNDYYR